MAVLKSEFEALLAEVARSEAANAEKDKHIEVTLFWLLAFTGSPLIPPLLPSF